MRNPFLAGMMMVGVLACSRNTETVTVSPARDNTVTVTRHNARLIPEGTQVTATVEDSINSRDDKVGDRVTATITQDVRDADGHVLFPRGSTAELVITEIRSSDGRGDPGAIGLDVSTVMVGGESYRVTSEVDSLSYQVRERGIEKEKVGIGAAAGALLGGVMTGSVKGAVVGGVLGGAAGAVVSDQTRDRDVIVRPGTQVQFRLARAAVVYLS